VLNLRKTTKESTDTHIKTHARTPQVSLHYTNWEL